MTKMIQKNRKGIIILFFIFSLVFSGRVFSQGGDNPCSATTVSSGGCNAGTTVGRTYSNNAANGGTPSCASPGAPDVWYTFTPTATGAYAIYTSAGSMTDSGISLYSASNCSSGFTEIVCDDESGAGSMSQIVTSLTAGTQYYIRVWAWGGSSTGTFSLCVFQAPNNDPCSGAISLTPGSPCISGTNVNSSTSATDPWPSCWASSQSNTVWYKFVADDDSMTVDLGSGTLGATTEAGVYNGTCAAPGTQVGCTENSTQIVMTTLVPGNTYYIIVDAQGTNVGTFCITVFDTPPPNPPVGNSCSNPRTLYPYTSCTAVTGAQYDNHDNQLGSGGDTPGSAVGFPLVGASPDPTCTSNDNTQRGYWVDFVATNTVTTFNNNDAAAAPPAICATAQDYAVYTGSCGSLTQVDCFSLGGSCGLGCCNPTTRNVNTVIGTHYYVLITPSGATSPGTDTRFLCITSATPSTPGGGVAANTCSLAPSINALTQYTINNANADISGTEPPLCVGSSENTVFVQWTVPAGWSNPTYVHLYNQDCNSSIGMQLSVFSAGTTCTTSPATCEIATNPGNTNDYTGSFTAVPGNTYLIALDGNAGAGCTFNFLIDHIVTVVTLPVELVSFEAKEKNRVVEINWVTASELNNDYFTIERSKDGVDFEKISVVKGAGTVNSPRSYTGYDYAPFSDVTYYRLKQTDYNGSFKYSNIISVSNLDILKETITVYPNPTNGSINLKLFSSTKSGVTLKMLNYTGDIVLEKYMFLEQGSNDFTFDLNGYEKGVYLLKADFEKTGKTIFNKIIKN